MHLFWVSLILGALLVALAFVLNMQELAAWVIGLGGGLAFALWTRHIRKSAPVPERTSGRRSPPGR